MPAVDFAESAGDQRRGDNTAVDEQIVNLERIGAPVVVDGVKRADLAGEVSFETTNAEEKTSECDKEGEIKRHQKVPGRHEQRADSDGAGAPEQAIGN